MQIRPSLLLQSSQQIVKERFFRTLPFLTVGRRQKHLQVVEAKGSSGSPEYHQAQLPLLLAVGNSSHLQSGAELVHPSRADHRKVAGE